MLLNNDFEKMMYILVIAIVISLIIPIIDLKYSFIDVSYNFLRIYLCCNII